MIKLSSRVRVAVVATIIGVVGMASAAPAFAFNPQPDPPGRHAHVSQARPAAIMTAPSAAQ